MEEGYLFYSSLTLVTLGSLALTLSILFRLKSRNLDSLPKNLSASVFNRTFTVFNPYPDKTKVIHHFVSVLPFIALVVALGLTFIFLKILTSGLILSVFIMIVGLNLIVVAEAPEVYMNSRTFIKAIHSGTNLASGDLRVLQLIRKLAPKLSIYYLALAIFFIISSIAVPYVSTSMPSLFMQLVIPITQYSGLNQIVLLAVVYILFALAFSLLQLLAIKIKGKIFKYETT